MRFLVIICLLLCGGCISTDTKMEIKTEPVDSSLLIKRTSMWVPDLDRAIVFFHDVIGLEIESQKELHLEKDSVLFDVFNADPELDIRRVIFSSPSQERVLFVMESVGAPEYLPGEKRSAILLIRTDDLAGVISRAKANGFSVGNTNVGTSPTSGRTSTETTVFGPGGNAVLMYQVSR